MPILLEAFFVVLGVVVALAANEAREYYNRLDHGEVALNSITRELEENRIAISEAITYHLQLSDTLGTFQPALVSDGSKASYPDARIFSKGFIAPAALLSTAWEAANATDALRVMNYEKVLLLSRIYESQEEYMYQSQQSGDLIFNKLFNEGYLGMLKNYQNLSTLISSFWYQECGLLSSYNKLILELDPQSESIEEPGICQVVRSR